MKQLSGLDTMFLNLETNAVPMHVAGLAIVDPATAPKGFGFESVKRLIEERLHLLPMFRRRLVTSPLNLDQPYWIEDPDFDLEQHVRHRALPRPGSDQQLADFVCDIVSTRLDRSMPLWRAYFIEGLKGGKVAILTKIHHACVDGVSGAEMMSTLLDLTPERQQIEPPETPWTPEPVPSPVSMAVSSARTLMTRPGDAIRLARETLPLLFSAGRAALAQRGAKRRAEAAQIEQGDSMKVGLAPRMLFNTTINARRSFAFGVASLNDVKLVKNAFGTSVNDVVLAISAEALRNYLLERGALPEKTLVAAIPVSVRTEAERGAAGNKVMMARSALGTHIADPVERLMAISRRMGAVKQSMKATPARLMMDWVNVPAPALLAQAARLYENFSMQDYVAPPYNLVISNVPGSAQPLYFAGARMLSNHPVSIPYHGLAFNITVMSYQDNLDIGLTGHRGTVPDPEKIVEGMLAALVTLKGRAKQHMQHSRGEQ
jgi:WS/DGAT/MGAT family acyltransferase